MNIVFDFGAVLFTWQPATLLSHHFPDRIKTPEQAQQWALDVFHHPDWQGFDSGTVELEDVVARTASRLLLAHDDLHQALAPIGERLVPIACNVELLARLCERRGNQEKIKLYFLSNMPAPFARALEQRHDFLQWFDGGIFSGDVKLAKPDPAIFKLLAARYQLDIAKTLFIDDSLANVQAADALGWHTIHCEVPELLPGQLMAKSGL